MVCALYCWRSEEREIEEAQEQISLPGGCITFWYSKRARESSSNIKTLRGQGSRNKQEGNSQKSWVMSHFMEFPTA